MFASVSVNGANVTEAEHCLREAIDLSKEQGARLFELRSAVSLCRLVEGPRKDAVRRELLRPLHDWFAKAADVSDLKEAQALLASPGVPSR